ncbi:MAG: tetratricopeptide repeat protein [Phycisphaerae bacterium]|nr:tetratricopeptide repeat protein [Phycisphaerae bacterium]
MSITSAWTGVRPIVAGRWQLPALAVSLLVFALGVVRLRAEPGRAGIERRIESVEVLLEAGRLADARDAIEKLRLQPWHRDHQKAAVHYLRAEVLRRTEEGCEPHRAAVVKQIIELFEKARALGRAESRDDLVHRAEVVAWSGDHVRAASILSEAVQRSSRGADSLRRRLAEWMEAGRVPSSEREVEALIDQVLTDRNAASVNVGWALERRVRRLLERGRLDEAETLIDRYGPRLGGTVLRDEVAYLRASTLARKGRRDEAEAMLRSLRDGWLPRDELWGKTTLLLGEINNREERPQAALSYFDEVLQSFGAGPLHEAALFGRAESLVLLDRFADAAETLERIVNLIARPEGSGTVDRESVRAFLRTAARLLEGRRLEGFAEDAVRYFEMSQKLLEPGDRQEAMFLAERLGTMHAQIAKAAAGAGDASKARRHHLSAARAYEALAVEQVGSADSAGRSIVRAADELQAAGELDQSVALMERFVEEHRVGSMTPVMLRRIGEARQSQGRLVEAIGVYRRLTEEFARTVEATRVTVLLADCLLGSGGDGARSAEDLLRRFVDQPPGAEAHVTPQAPEYRDALARLAEIYRVSDRFELAATRFEDALAMFPDDARAAQWRYLLADCYRRSSRALPDAPADGRLPTGEAAVRLERALASYVDVIRSLAAQDEPALSAVERTYLRVAYLHRADCLFDLGRYAEAVTAYSEAMWRYERDVTVLPAALQIVQCHLRMGRSDAARRSLEQLRWLLRKLPDSAFAAERGMPDRAHWERLTEQLAASGLLG